MSIQQPRGQLYPERIPKELRSTAQWVGWRYETRDGKVTKVLWQTGKRARADSTNPATWSTFEQALSAVKRYGYDGIGFVFADGWAGVDLDKCRDPETEELTQWATDLLVHFEWNAYIEVSPSGTGIHIIGRGIVPGTRHKTNYHDGAVEMYDADRFFTVTGNVLSEGPIGDISQGLATVYAEVFPPQDGRPALRVIPSPTQDDERVLDLAFRAANGEETARLYAGDPRGDHSAADLALLSRLAFYTQDTAQLDRLLRGSGLYREKWERQDYRERTISKALDQRETYNPARVREARTDSRSKPPEVTYVTADTSTDARIAALEAKIAAQEARIGELERKLAEERAARSELVYALRNKAVKTERGTAIAAACILEHKKGQNPAGVELPGKGSGWHHVYLDAVAEQAGCSPQRASAHLDRLTEWGVLEKAVHWGSRDRINPETGEITREGVKEMYLRTEQPLSHTLATLATIKPEKPQTWGGKRPKACPDHPEAGTVKRWSLHCQECDRLLDEGEEHQRPPSFQDEGSSIGGAVVVDPSFQDESRGKRRVRKVPIATTNRNHPRSNQ